MARTQSTWESYSDSYVAVPWAEGRNVLIRGTSKYINFGSLVGESGYGFRDNAGTMQVKNSGGSWANFGGGGGGGQVDTVVGGTGIDVNAADPVNPIVDLDAASIASLALADTALQPGDIATAFPTFMFSATNSDISGYESAPSLNVFVAGAEANNGGTAASTTPAIMEEFATDVGYPNITLLPAGIITVHFETTKGAGANNYYCYAEIYKRVLAGTETLLATTENSTVSALNTRVQQTVTAVLAANTTLLSTDRIVVKVYCVMVSSTATITLYYDDATSARVELPPVAIDTTEFITRTVVVTSGNVTAGSTHSTDYVYKLAGLHTVTLPTAVGNTNQYDIINLHSANNSIATTSSQTIHGTSAPITIVPNQSLTLQSDGTNWMIK